MGKGRLCAALGVALLAAVLAGSAGGAGAKQGASYERNDASRQYVPGQVVVGFRPNVDPVSRLEALSDASASTVEAIGSLNAKLVSVDGSVSGAIAELKSNPAVAYAEPNWIYHTEAVPNDPRYSQTYGLPKIQAPQAWDVTTGSAGVTVAVVDTGVSSGRSPRVRPIISDVTNSLTRSSGQGGCATNQRDPQSMFSSRSQLRNTSVRFGAGRRSENRRAASSSMATLLALSSAPGNIRFPRIPRWS